MKIKIINNKSQIKKFITVNDKSINLETNK